MSQNVPPTSPDQDPNGERVGGDHANPYFARQNAEQPPDLDAGAPVLRSAEMQRMNRKALMFLGAVVLLLLLMGYFVIRSVTSRNAPEEQKVREEQVIVPDAPDTPPLPVVDPVSQPIEVVQTPMDPMPPLPESTMGPAYPPPPSFEPRDTGPRGPTLMERRMSNAEGSAGGGQLDPAQAAQQQALSEQTSLLQQLMGGQQPQQAEPSSPATSAKYLFGPDTMLVRGTYLRCVLETRVITDVPGYTSCILTGPVYSVNGKRLLLPKGSKLLGSYGKSATSRDRVAVIWDRIITPNGIDVSMASPGIDNLGGAGHPGDYDAHWPSRISSALLISLISDVFKYGAQKHGPPTTITYPSGIVIEQPFESNTARAIQDIAGQAVEESANRKPTVTINQGTVVTVYVSKDVDFSRVVAGR